jgi:hypothetical protein
VITVTDGCFAVLTTFLAMLVPIAILLFFALAVSEKSVCQFEKFGMFVDISECCLLVYHKQLC